ncbi:MAG: endopeptidase La [Chloroflexota bacterium]|nr:endopeptidase La [Chloroflexota bacterium]
MTVRQPPPEPGGQSAETLVLPVLVMDETVLLPHMSLPLPIEDDETAAALDAGAKGDRLVLLLTERPVPPGDGDGAAAGDEDEYELCEVGVIAEIGQRLTRPGGPTTAILQGEARGRVLDFGNGPGFPLATVERHDDPPERTPEAETAMATVLEQVETYLGMLPSVPEEVLTMIRGVDEPGWLADLICFSPDFTSEQRQAMLEEFDPVARLKSIGLLVQRRLDVLDLRQQIQAEAQSGMDKQQREYYLREQLRAIQKELGEGSPEATLAAEMREKIEAAGMPDAVKAKAVAQAERLEQQPPHSPEIGIIRTYLEWLTELPWAIETPDQLALSRAARVLDEDHYGLEKVKERILEYIAVRKLAGPRMKAPILCFVGPPGVGKTSLGRSIARALARNYGRMALGGVHDEAEIRGHRRTYVGAMPGRVIKALRDAGSRNPVLILDEIDKLGADWRGDPSSALLEVLDPEQNNAFSDHYLEVPFDLSGVLFITTANQLDPIPAPLRDRMEIIEVSGYTELEKLQIARNFLLPKQLEAHGLTPEQLAVTDEALLTVTRSYTRESGVRGLEREISAICRKVARRVAEATEEAESAAGGATPIRLLIEPPQIEDYLGVPRFEHDEAEREDEVGVATGAAYTGVGGDLLGIEVLLTEGKGDIILTGQLGDVMQESARAAVSYARSRAPQLGVEPGYFDKRTIHVHVPAGATPKDGPSAGITIATALISALTGIRVRKDVAMTGEITLRGKVLPIGGLKEKTLAAHRAGLRTFILPRRNAKDLAELPDLVKNDLHFIQVDHLDEVLNVALVQTPQRNLQVA